MKLSVGCELAFESDAPVPMLVLVRARPDGPRRATRESSSTVPDVAVREYLDGFGNACWRLTTPVGPLTLRYEAEVEVDRQPDVVVPDALLAPPQDLPDDTLVFTLPSRPVEADLLLSDAWRLF